MRLGSARAVALCLSFLSGAAWAEVGLTVVEARSRSALVSVDEATANAVAAASVWETVAPEGLARSVQVVRGAAAEGSACASIAGYTFGPECRVDLVQVLAEPPEPQRAYVVSVTSRGRIGALGEATAFLESRLGPDQPWTEVVRFPLDALDTWLSNEAEFRLETPAPDVRVGVRLSGKGALLVDDVRVHPAGEPARNLASNGGFEGASSWRLHYRAAGESEWVADPAVIHEASHALLGLRPGTRYEIKAERLDRDGAVVDESMPMALETLERYDREGVGVTASEPAPAAAVLLSSPALVSTPPRAMLVAVHGGGLYAHPVERDGSLSEPYRVVPATDVNGRNAQVEAVRACTLDDTLYVLYRAILGPRPADWSLRMVAMDLRSGETRGPFSVPPAAQGSVCVAADVAVVEGELLLACLEWDLEEGAAGVSRLFVRRLRPRTMEVLAPDAPLALEPDERPGEPALARLGDRTVVLYTDLAHVSGVAGVRQAQEEPLYARFWDGASLSERIVVCADGRSRAPAGAEADGRLAIVWQWGGPYPEAAFGEHRLHDIGLAWLSADGAVEGPWSCVHDQTHNASPTIAEVGGRLYVVFDKAEHLQGLPDDPAASLGLWSVWLERQVRGEAPGAAR